MRKRKDIEWLTTGRPQQIAPTHSTVIARDTIRDVLLAYAQRLKLITRTDARLPVAHVTKYEGLMMLPAPHASPAERCSSSSYLEPK